jgi:hypothetical protein
MTGVPADDSYQCWSVLYLDVVRTFRSAVSGRPHGEEETAELAKTAGQS